MFVITTSGALEQNKHTKLPIFLLPLNIFWIFFQNMWKKDGHLLKPTFFHLLNTALSSGKKHEKMVLNLAKTGCVGGQIWSDQHQILQKLFSKLTSTVKKR